MCLLTGTYFLARMVYDLKVSIIRYFVIGIDWFGEAPNQSIPKSYLPNLIFPFGYIPDSPNISSMRISWLYFAILSVLDAEPVLI